MEDLGPSVGTRSLSRREARLAWSLLSPTVVVLILVVFLPLLAIFWISFKPVVLGDLRAPKVTLREDIRGDYDVVGDAAVIRYRLRNSSQNHAIADVKLTDTIPLGLILQGLDPRCDIAGRALLCDLGDWQPGARETITIPVIVEQAFLDNGLRPQDSPAVTTGVASNILTNSTFTVANFQRIFSGDEFFDVLWVTLLYTVFGTIGALVVGLFAALLLNKTFRGRGILRGLYLFPYVAPIIAVAFTWLVLFDPFSGSANALLIQMGVTTQAINFFGERPLALIMVTIFEIWRYFPLTFLFILARMQNIDSDMYEAADMDGASPFQQFWYLSLPHLMGIISILFLLRFIWTFNKFDDIFLLTGGNAGTRTLTVNVYEQAFAISNIGAGAAVAVIIFVCLLTFSAVFLKYISREEGL